MLKFKSFLNEELAGGTGAGADSLGKRRELGLGRALNNGQPVDSYRSEGKTPEQMYDNHAKKLHGENYNDDPTHVRAVDSDTRGAQEIKNYLKRRGHGNVVKTVWTSQPSDHESETGVNDPNSTADNVITTDKKTNGNANKIGISVKTGKTGTINWDNPGLNRLIDLSGVDLQQHTIPHKELTNELGTGSSHKLYKELRDSSDVKDQAKAALIKSSSNNMNQAVARDFHGGLANMSHEQLKDVIVRAVSPPTHLTHIVSHQILDKNGHEKAHHIFDEHEHVNDYLNNFESFHMQPLKPGQTSVTIHGRHKKTGKIMPIAKWSIYAGGRPAGGSPRGATTLPSEYHKDIEYSDNEYRRFR